MEIVVDAYTPEERVLGWYCYPAVTTQLAPAGPQSGVSWLTRWRHITIQTLTARSVVRAEQAG